MELLFLFILAIGLSLDTFAVSVSCGCIETNIRFKEAVRIALFFAFFQAVMPFFGWLIGNIVYEYVSAIDHWIAFGLLFIIGVKMIIESIRGDEGTQLDIHNIKVILTMSVATTIDAFVVGLVFSSLQTTVWMALPIIGAVTFLAAMLGMLFGKKAGVKFGKRMEIVGGIILIGIGTKILLEHIL